MARKTRNTKKHHEDWHPLIWASFLACSLLILPVVQHNAVMDISMMPRLLAALIILMLFTLVFFLQKKHLQPDLNMIRMAIFPVFAGVVASIVVSMFFSVNISAGYYDLIKTVATACFLLFASWIIAKTPTWQLPWAKFFVSGALLSLAMGYYQYITTLGLGFHERHLVVELKGLMSNVNLYASYLMLLLPGVIYGIFTLRRGWQALAVLATALNLVFIFLLQTRAAYVGVFLSTLCCTILALILSERLQISKWVRKAVAIAMIAGLVLLAGIFVLLPPDNKYIARASSVFTDRENPRLVIWRATSDMIADHMFTGVGAGNFPIVLQSYFGNYNLEGIDTNWLRPHNDYLWVWSEKGIAGLILFLAFFAIAIYYAAVVLRKAPDPNKKWFALCALGGILAYMTNAAFDFPLERMNHQVLLMLYLAPLVAMVYKLRETTTPSRLRFRQVSAGLVFFFFVGWVYCSQAIALEKHVKTARQANVSRDWQAMLQSGQQAKTIWKNLDPLAVPVSFFEGYAHFQMGNMDQALTAFLDAYEKNPYRKYILNNIGVIYQRTGQYEEARIWFGKTLAMFPDDVETIRNMMESFAMQGDHAKALEWFEKIPADQRDERLMLWQQNLLQSLNPKH